MTVGAVLGQSAAWSQVAAKRPLPAIDAPACQAVEQAAKEEQALQISRATRYFAPVFSPGPDGGLRQADRYNCLKMEGACLVGRYPYPSDGTRVDRSSVKTTYGPGSGTSKYSTTSALFPCRTIAADLTKHPVGTAIYIPALMGKACPQNGYPVDGCFVAGDKGGKIKGRGRFGLFTGECLRYNDATKDCDDPQHLSFAPPTETTFYEFDRDSKLAQALREEMDAFVDAGWKP